jgi:hypothetical protein
MRKVVRLSILFLAILAVAPAAIAAEMIWPIANATPYSIDLQFYARGRSWVWPQPGRVFYVLPGRTMREIDVSERGAHLLRRVDKGQQVRELLGRWPRRQVRMLEPLLRLRAWNGRRNQAHSISDRVALGYRCFATAPLSHGLRLTGSGAWVAPSPFG